MLRNCQKKRIIVTKRFFEYEYVSIEPLEASLFALDAKKKLLCTTIRELKKLLIILKSVTVNI